HHRLAPLLLASLADPTHQHYRPSSSVDRRTSSLQCPGVSSHDCTVPGNTILALRMDDDTTGLSGRREDLSQYPRDQASCWTSSGSSTAYRCSLRYGLGLSRCR